MRNFYRTACALTATLALAIAGCTGEKEDGSLWFINLSIRQTCRQTRRNKA